MTLSEIARKVHRGGDLTSREAVFVKQEFKSFRRAYDAALADVAADEYPTLAIDYSIKSLELCRLSHTDFVDEIRHAYHDLCDKRRVDRRLRTEIAYRMAYCVLFSRTFRASQPRQGISLSCHELLHHLTLLQAAFSDYARWKAAEQAPPTAVICQAA